MTDEQIALARRAVACKGWRWMPGMEFDLNGAGALSSGWRIQSVQMRAVNGWARAVRTVTAGPCEFIIAPRGNIHVRFLDSTIASKPSGTAMLPVLDDPATLGCLLALVREAWGKPAVPMYWGDYWQVVHTLEVEDGCAGHQHMGDGDTEAEALVAALEAAP